MSMDFLDTTLLDDVRSIARRAGDAILDVYRRDFDVDFKDDRSPLTEADRVAHELIAAALATLTPNWPVLSEEAAAADIDGRRDWVRYWLVDPLDGTKEFVKRNGEFTVNIALIDGHAPVLGVVTAPALDLAFCGMAGHGAFRSDGDGAPAPIVCVPAADPVRVVGSRSHPSGRLAEYLAAIGPHSIEPMGSSLKICRVAEGLADVYPRFGPTSEWDTAAAQAVLESAGGRMIDLTGRPLRYNTKDDLLNPHFLAYGDGTRDWLAATGPSRSGR